MIHEHPCPDCGELVATACTCDQPDVHDMPCDACRASRNRSARLFDAMIAVARSAPAKRRKHVYSAQIPWTLVEELRDALDAARIEWRS